MQLDHFIDVFLALHVTGAYAHHQEHQMLSCSIQFSAPSLWMDGGLESRCGGCVDGAVQLSHTAPSAPYTQPPQRLSSPPSIHKLSAENHMLLLMMGVCARNM